SGPSGRRGSGGSSSWETEPSYATPTGGSSTSSRAPASRVGCRDGVISRRRRCGGRDTRAEVEPVARARLDRDLAAQERHPFAHAAQAATRNDGLRARSVVVDLELETARAIDQR